MTARQRARAWAAVHGGLLDISPLGRFGEVLLHQRTGWSIEPWCDWRWEETPALSGVQT